MVPSHIGIPRNKEAGTLGKMGAELARPAQAYDNPTHTALKGLKNTRRKELHDL